jgi:DNA-binding transcriptional regulator YiaG
LKPLAQNAPQEPECPLGDPSTEAYLWEKHTDENTNLFGISRPQPRLRDFDSWLRQCARLRGARGKLECTGLTAIRLAGSPEESPELARYLVEPLVLGIDRPLTKSPARKGRPVILVDGERIKELRGEYTQALFARLCKVSVDALQRAERRGRSSEKTIRKIVGKLQRQGRQIEVKNLIKNTPQ